MKISIDSIMLNSYKLFHSLCFYQLRRVATLLLCYEVFPHLLIEFSALVDIGGVIFVFWIRNASRAFHELLVRSFFLHFAVGQHVDLVNVHDAGESVGTVYHSLTFEDLLQLLCHALLGLGVQVACSLIKQEDLGILLEKAPRNKYSLPLASREHRSQVAYLCLVSVFHLYDLLVNMALLADLNDFFHGRIWITVLEIE